MWVQRWPTYPESYCHQFWSFLRPNDVMLLCHIYESGWCKAHKVAITKSNTVWNTPFGNSLNHFHRLRWFQTKIYGAFLFIGTECRYHLCIKCLDNFGPSPQPQLKTSSVQRKTCSWPGSFIWLSFHEEYKHHIVNIRLCNKRINVTKNDSEYCCMWAWFNSQICLTKAKRTHTLIHLHILYTAMAKLAQKQSIAANQNYVSFNISFQLWQPARNCSWSTVLVDL